MSVKTGNIYTCDRCGVSFVSNPIPIKYGLDDLHFCSENCAVSYLSENKEHINISISNKV